jgi:hypothetical protein
MARRESGRLTSISFLTQGLAALALLLAGVSVAPTAGAAKLSQVRVGTHGDTTRIVLELDGPAPYRLMPSSSGGPLRIALDADSVARSVHSKSPLVRSVRVEPAQHGSTISVDLAKPDVSVEEMILAHPARIVLDLKRAGAPDAATARALATAAAMAEKPAPAEAPVAAATPPPPAAPNASPSLSDPVPSDIAGARPAGSSPSPAPAAAPEAAPAVPAPALSEDQAAPSAPSAPAASEAAAPPASGAPVASEPSEPASPKPAEVVVRKPTPPPVQEEARDEGSLIGTLLSPTGFAVLAAVLVGLIVLGAMRRRREREDDDPLYSVMSADDAGSGAAHEDVAPRWADDSPEETGAPRASLPEPEPRSFQIGADEPDAADSEPQLSLRGRPPAEPEGDSIFGGAPAPTYEPVRTPEPAPRTNGTELPGVASELAGRVSDLERRLEQLTEARERLERQVAAQTEELRVQRAAIARTQRVVRSMNKGEDLATEPVPRAPNA